MENILIDSDYNLKVTDFGFAGPTTGSCGAGKSTTTVGTLSMMAPEQHLEIPYVGKQIDIFSTGIVLFTMHSGHFPFEHAVANDDNYKYIAANRTERFWKSVQQHSKHKYSENFKHFFNSMV